MTENMADATYRGYNYPHQAATWLGLYRVARFYDKLQVTSDWATYLYGAFRTMDNIGEANVGFMDGTVFREILVALEQEGKFNATIAGWASKASASMAARAAGWSKLLFPYGSEFNYDTTGQEEVFIWLQHFGYNAQANSTLNSILSYMRSRDISSLVCLIN